MQEGLVEMTITEAATHLGITAEAVRKRIYRGDLEDRKRAGKWVIRLSATAAGPRQDQRQDEAVTDLRAQLAAKDQQIHELHVILARLPDHPRLARQPRLRGLGRGVGWRHADAR